MGATDRRAQLAGIVEKLVNLRALGEDTGYDITPVILPGPSGPQAGYLLILSARSPVLKPPRMAFSHAIPDAWPDEEQLADAVGHCMQGLAKTRLSLLGKPAPGGAAR